MDGGYLVRGHKVWTSTAQVANKIMLLARTTRREAAARGPVPDIVTEDAGWLGNLEPVPGRWLDGSAWSLHGWIGFRPWILPRRRYRCHAPENRQ